MLSIPRTVKVVSVDHYGFNGREHHPLDSDIGTVLTVLKVEIEGRGETFEGEDISYEVWYCLRSDDSLLEMVGHEIEAV